MIITVAIIIIINIILNIIIIIAQLSYHHHHNWYSFYYLEISFLNYLQTKKTKWIADPKNLWYHAQKNFTGELFLEISVWKKCMEVYLNRSKIFLLHFYDT